jgi:hypothetical protein
MSNMDDSQRGDQRSHAIRTFFKHKVTDGEENHPVPRCHREKTRREHRRPHHEQSTHTRQLP